MHHFLRYFFLWNGRSTVTLLQFFGWFLCFTELCRCTIFLLGLKVLHTWPISCEVEHTWVRIILPLMINFIFLCLQKIYEIALFGVVKMAQSRFWKSVLLLVHLLVVNAWIGCAPAKTLVHIASGCYLKVRHVRCLQESALLAGILILAIFNGGPGHPWLPTIVKGATCDRIEAPLGNHSSIDTSAHTFPPRFLFSSPWMLLLHWCCAQYLLELLLREAMMGVISIAVTASLVYHLQ